jgi:hypothetical protein
VADALSRRDTEEDGALLALSAPHFDFLARLRQLHDTDPTLVTLREEITAGSRSAPWTFVDGMVQLLDGCTSPRLSLGPGDHGGVA